MIKRIAISAAIIVGIAGLTASILFLTTTSNDAMPEPETPSPQSLVLDYSKDYGACELLDSSTIKTALGDVASTLQPFENAGITKDTYFGEQVKDVVSDSQTCIYAFAPGNKTETTLSGTNAFFVKKTRYTNPQGPKNLIEQSKANPTAKVIDSLGDSAFYTANTAAEGPGATANFELLVFKNNESISYSIIQPAEKMTFTAESAKTALLTLAQ